MSRTKFMRGTLIYLLLLLTVMLTAACNLTSAPEEAINNTAVPTGLATITTTPLGIPTSVGLTGLPPFTQSAPPTSIFQLPPTISVASATPGFISIFIVSPIPGNVIAGNVQVLGSAIHPDFLQYQLEFGPEPNPANLWYLIGGVHLTPVINNLLGIWSTTDGRSPDGLYQIRLRVFLRDGTVTQTVVNNIHVQNQAPTLAPTATQTIPRPIAAFVASPTSGTSPLVVTFTNLSSGNITGYTWNFGDGSTDASVNPVHTFRAAGSYTVRLTTSGPGGQSNVSRTIDVQTADPPKAKFITDVSQGIAPLSVNFTNQSTGRIDSYLWDFGDGSSTNEQNPRHRFLNKGTYNVILEVRGPGGIDRKRVTITVTDPQVPAPVADFIPKTTTGNAPLTIQFADRSTGQINNYEWDFGDGTTAGTQNPQHLYQNPGTFTVKLTVSGTGGTNTTSGTVTVNQAPQAPDAKFTALPTSGDAPLSVNFTSQSTGTINRYEWSFGDGAQVDTRQNPDHTFNQPGTYTVRLTVFGPNNTFDYVESPISVSQPPKPPKAAFTVDKTQGSAPIDVTFTSQSSGDNLTFLWNFGDGTTSDSSDAQITHRYTTNGVYSASLRVSNNQGQSDTATQTITVTDTLNASFNVAQLVDQPLTVQFSSTSSGSIATYTWNFGDSSPVSTAGATVTHTYPAAGSYSVTLTIADSTSGTASTTQQITVIAPTATATSVPPTDVPTSTPQPQAPTASFTANTVDNITYDFTDTSQPVGEITAWLWNFGDGSSSNEQNPHHTFSSNGSYGVKLTVTGAGGTSQPATQIVQVSGNVAAPVASFTINTTDNITYNFTNTSQPVGTITGWFWDFSGLGTSNEQNPSFAFPQNGDYMVTLTVTNSAGTSQPFSQPITVSGNVAAPVASFTVNTTDNITYNFTDTSQPVGTITGWFWDFSGLGTSNEQNPSFTFPQNGDYMVTLTVTNSAGTSQPFRQPITVSGNVAAPVASFTINTTDNITYNFTDTSQPVGTITGWFWDFSGLGTSNAQNPSFAFPQNGDYMVTLTVTNSAGTSQPFSQPITVNGNVAAPTASFTANTADNITYNFTDTSQPVGSIKGWQWDFGGLGTSNEQNPSFTFPKNGDYLVALTVTGDSGDSQPYTETISVTGNSDNGNVVDTTPALPDIRSLGNALQNMSNFSHDVAIFGLAGDNSIKQDGFLKPFADGNYQLDDSSNSLQTTIDAYVGSTSFDRASVAVGGDLTVSSLINDTPDGCNGETRFQCELTQSNGAIVVISIGLRDALNGTGIDSFGADYDTLLQTAIDNGVIPVVLTIYPRPGSEDAIKVMNEVIIQVAASHNVPVINIWKLFSDIGSSAMDGNNPSVGAGSADILTADVVSSAGENARNDAVLTVLMQIRQLIFGQG